MSHFINTQGQIDVHELLQGEIIEIKAPAHQRLSKQFDNQHFSNDEASRAIRRIVARESELGLAQHQRKLRDNMTTLKKRMKGFGQRESNHIPFERNIESQNRKLTCQPTELVDIQKKYNVELSIKFNALKECENIQCYRKHVIKWRNSQQNHIRHNPNFVKMNYLIARAREEDKENEIFSAAEKPSQGRISADWKRRTTDRGYRGFMSLSKQKQMTEH